MLTIRQIRFELRDRNISKVAREIDMSRQQLWAIANGLTANPTGKTLEKISNYLEAGEDDQEEASI